MLFFFSTFLEKCKNADEKITSGLTICKRVRKHKQEKKNKVEKKNYRFEKQQKSQQK